MSISQPGMRSDGVPQACVNAAHHVANCPRCFAALRAHLGDVIDALLNVPTH